MINEDHLLRKIREFSDTWIVEPTKDLSKLSFDTVAYSLWAIDEITYRLMDEMYKLPYHITGKTPTPYEDIIVEFIDDMDYMADHTVDNHKRFIFLVARDTGAELLLFLEGELNG